VSTRGLPTRSLTCRSCRVGPRSWWS
jgi:hypothetical protein